MNGVKSIKQDRLLVSEIFGYCIYNNSSLSINDFSLTTGHLYLIMMILDDS